MDRAARARVLLQGSVESDEIRRAARQMGEAALGGRGSAAWASRYGAHVAGRTRPGDEGWLPQQPPGGGPEEAPELAGSRSGLESRHDVARRQKLERKRKSHEGFRDREAEEAERAGELLEQYLDATLSWGSGSEGEEEAGEGKGKLSEAARALFEPRIVVSLLPGGPPLVIKAEEPEGEEEVGAPAVQAPPPGGRATARSRLSARPRAIAEDADAALLNAGDSDDSGSDAGERQRRRTELLNGCVWEPEGLFPPRPEQAKGETSNEEQRNRDNKGKEKRKDKKEKKDKKERKERKEAQDKEGERRKRPKA